MQGGVEAMSMTPEAMQRFIVSEQKRWGAVKEKGVRSRFVAFISHPLTIRRTVVKCISK